MAENKVGLTMDFSEKKYALDNDNKWSQAELDAKKNGVQPTDEPTKEPLPGDGTTTTTTTDGTTPPVDTAVDPGKIQADNILQQNAMLAAQTAMQLNGMRAQLITAGLNMMGQTVGATTAMAVQTVTDLVKTTKDSVKAQGEAFQKAN